MDNLFDKYGNKLEELAEPPRVVLDKNGNVITPEFRALLQDLEDNDGYGIFDALFNLEGEIVPSKRFMGTDSFSGEDRPTWGIFGTSIEYNSKTKFESYLNESQAQSETQRIKNVAKKGYYLGTVEYESSVRLIRGVPTICMVNPYDYDNFRILDDGQEILKELKIIS